MPKNKTEEVDHITLRIPLRVKEEFQLVARERGLTMSAVLNQYIRQLIREEKKIAPELFEELTREKMAA